MYDIIMYSQQVAGTMFIMAMTACILSLGFVLGTWAAAKKNGCIMPTNSYEQVVTPRRRRR